MIGLKIRRDPCILDILSSSSRLSSLSFLRHRKCINSCLSILGLLIAIISSIFLPSYHQKFLDFDCQHQRFALNTSTAIDVKRYINKPQQTIAMAYVSLSTRDLNVLEKIQDPEYDPARIVQVDMSLPKDPNFKDQAVYDKVAQLEREIILSIQQLELANAMPAAHGTTDVEGTIQGYRNCITQLGSLIQEYPGYASAHNNRAQAIRRLVGDSMLISGSQQLSQALIRDIDDAERLQMAETALSDLDRAISLLTPTTPQTRVSQNVARTLSNAHTQRAAIYHMTSKLMESNTLAVPQGRREGSWSKLDFEENASRDFAMGGRYGNEIAKALAVSTNPTAKLCGQMVREALKKEYGPAYSA